MSQTILLHGQFESLSSFALVNRQLAKGLQAHGYRVTVMPSDGQSMIGLPIEEPDIYLAHDHPYDVLNAPGRVNAFLLEYEYARILKRDQLLVERLNHFFDLVLAPSQFVREVCEASGIRVPVVVCPLGVDPSEFHPDAPPVTLPTKRRFKFLYLGGANERKGTDILLKAFVQEFTAQDDVTLILKTFGYEHLHTQFERQVTRLQRRRNAPEIIHLHERADSVAGYFTAADCGVFPFRGEGFGLPILECLACGRPVIVTHGGAPFDYCNERNALFIPAANVTRRGKSQLEPDGTALRKLLRRAYEGGLPSATPYEISASVADWTWERTTAHIHNALQAHATFVFQTIPASIPPSDAPRVGYAFYQKGVTSWKKTARVIDHTLTRNHTFDYVPLGFQDPPSKTALQLVWGESGYALEHFVRAARLNPNVRRILARGSGPFETMVAIENRERELCGVPLDRYEPMEYWRNRRECELADRIVVPGHASEKLFLQAHYPAHKFHVLPLGIESQPQPEFRRGRTLRFLYIATKPFRKGVRVLFQAWDALQPEHAELVCIASNEILQSPLLLRYLVRNPTITFKPLMSRRQLVHEYVNCDCQVLPSFEDGYAVAVAEGMGFGKPAILAEDVGLCDLIAHEENGYIVPTGSAPRLRDAFAYFCENRRIIRAMGQAAYETTRQYSWARFERELISLVQADLDHV